MSVGLIGEFMAVKRNEQIKTIPLKNNRRI
jgi:hypothetical protein